MVDLSEISLLFDFRFHSTASKKPTHKGCCFLYKHLVKINQ